jgi:hypothetical protein
VASSPGAKLLTCLTAPVMFEAVYTLIHSRDWLLTTTSSPTAHGCFIGAARKLAQALAIMQQAAPMIKVRMLPTRSSLILIDQEKLQDLRPVIA